MVVFISRIEIISRRDNVNAIYELTPTNQFGRYCLLHMTANDLSAFGFRNELRFSAII